jgi:hypothetical protein
MFKTRVKFKTNNDTQIHMGYIIKSKRHGGFKVVSANRKSTYTIELLDMLEKI